MPAAVRFVAENAEPAPLELAVYDQTGRLVWSQSTRPHLHGDFSFHWPCAHAARGVYIARVLQGNRQWKRSVLVLR
jgi:hypothetical protein